MSEKRNIFILILCLMLLIGSSRAAESKARIYPQDIGVTFEYDNNVTRERFRKDYQYGIIWWPVAGFGIENFIPVKGLDTRAEYTLRMYDVNTTNNEDYSSQKIFLSSGTKLKTGTGISLKETFRIWNSQSDLFNFYDNAVEIGLSQPLGEKTSADLAYMNRQKRFQNSEPEVQARNFLYHQIGMDVSHKISHVFWVRAGYAYQSIMYNRSPIDFKGDRPVALDGVQRDRQNVITLGFRRFLLNNAVILELLNQVVNSNSNSRAFDFNGNRTWIVLLIKPSDKLSVDFTYRIVAYNLGAYQTPELGYELSEIRVDDQSGIMLGATYDVSDQVSLQFRYERTENTVFFTRESYKKNIFSTGLNVKF